MKKLHILLALSFLILYLINLVNCSVGDRSIFYTNCRKGCKYQNCTEDGQHFLKPPTFDGDFNYIFNRLLLWNCDNECSYYCMWRTTNGFIHRGWNIPQFHGKWPFRRYFGLQEPASVFFSLLNLLANWHMIRKFRLEVRKDSPMYYVWHISCGIAVNTWIWSCVFHARDYPITEFLDYAFAYSMVLCALICMILRMLHNHSSTTKASVVFAGVLFFLRDFLQLNIGHLYYGYNMKKNIVTGVLTGLGWIIWYLPRRKSHPYGWKMIKFQMLAGASLLLELNDFPPIFWTFDAHSLWHLSTAPLTILFYNFAIEDCKRLRQDKYGHENDKMKLI